MVGDWDERSGCDGRGGCDGHGCEEHGVCDGRDMMWGMNASNKSQPLFTTFFTTWKSLDIDCW